MSRFKPYGFVNSRYPLWSERDLKWAYYDQLKMAVILLFMILAVTDVFLYFKFRFGTLFWTGSVLVVVIFSICMIPLWIYTKNWIKGMEGTFYLRARSDDAGYNLLRGGITTILKEAKINHKITDSGFQASLGTDWLPAEEIMTFTGPLNIVKLRFDITATEGLEITLNSLSKFPGLEEKLIPGLDGFFIINKVGTITVKSE